MMRRMRLRGQIRQLFKKDLLMKLIMPNWCGITERTQVCYRNFCRPDWKIKTLRERKSEFMKKARSSRVMKTKPFSNEQ